MLKAYSTVTGGVLHEDAQILEDEETVLVDGGEPLYFTIEEHQDDIGEHVADAIRALVEFHAVSGSISGYDFLDVNYDEDYDLGEPQPKDPPVYASLYGLSEPGDIEHAIKAIYDPITDGYSFPNLRPAIYSVWVDPAYRSDYCGITDPYWDLPEMIPVGRGINIEGVDFRILDGFVQDDYAETDADTSVDVYVLANDVWLDTMTFQSFTQPENGEVSWNASYFTYTPDNGWHGKDTFTYTLRFTPAPPLDPIDMTAMVTVCVGEAPVLDLDADDSTAGGADFAGRFVAMGGPVNVTDIDATLSDADDTYLQSLTMTLTNRPNSWYESLSADTTGTNITAAAYNRFTGKLVLSGNDTIANYITVLRSITYNNTKPYPDATPREIEFVVNDSAFDSNVGTATISIEYAPWVAQIEVGNATAMYEIETDKAGHTQLLPIQLDDGVDRVRITFNRPINDDDLVAVREALTVNGRFSGDWGAAAGVSLNGECTEATWTFSGGPYKSGEMILQLADTITAEGIALDGEWTSPSTFNDNIKNSNFGADFASGNGTPGGDFVFNFTLPNTRGGDASRDGIVNEADVAIVAMNWMQGPGMDWTDGDFNYDGYVNEIDNTILASNWQKHVWTTHAFDADFDVSTGGELADYLYGPAQGPGDGLMYYLVSQAAHGSVTVNADGSFTYTPSTGYNGVDAFTFRAYDGVDYSDPATVTINVGDAPTVTCVYVGNLLLEDWAEIATAADNDDQLIPVPIYDGIDSVCITFDRNVSLTSSDLTLNGYSATSFTAGDWWGTWTFDGPDDGTFKFGPMIIELSDAVNTNGLALDGEWINPEHYGDDEGNSTFDGGLTSGDGVAGGDFVFNFSMLFGGDTNCDGDVDGDDFIAFSSGWFGPDGADPINPSPPAHWTTGDFDDDGDVDGDDFIIFSINWQQTVWPEPEQMCMGGGGSGGEWLSASAEVDGEISLVATLDAFFEKYGLSASSTAGRTVVGSEEWDDFLDEFALLADRLDKDAAEVFADDFVSPHKISKEPLASLWAEFELVG